MKLFVFVVAAMFVTACTPVAEEGVVVEIGDRTWVADVADTQEEHEKGLMNVESMPKNRGMLFIFPDERQRTFWMKDTKIPLDIIYISKNWRITHIVENAVPCTADPCEVYPSERPSQYVLELNSGQVKEKNVRVGQLVQTSID